MSQWDPRYDPDAHERRARSGQPPQGYHPGTQQQPWQPQWPPPPQQFPPQGRPPQYPPPGHRQPPRKRRKGGLIVGIIGGAVVLVIAIAAAASGGKPAAPAVSDSTTAAAGAAAPAVTTAAAPAAASKITYRVTGSAADVQYGPAGSNYQAKVPLNETGRIGARPAAYYAITAQLNGGGKVTCEILIDGTVISKSTATGGYNIADCEVMQDPFSGGWQDANAA